MSNEGTQEVSQPRAASVSTRPLIPLQANVSIGNSSDTPGPSQPSQTQSTIKAEFSGIQFSGIRSGDDACRRRLESIVDVF